MVEALSAKTIRKIARSGPESEVRFKLYTVTLGAFNNSGGRMEIILKM